MHNSTEEHSQGNVFSAEIWNSNQSNSLRHQATFTEVLTHSLISQYRLTEVNDLIFFFTKRSHLKVKCFLWNFSQRSVDYPEVISGKWCCHFKRTLLCKIRIWCFFKWAQLTIFFECLPSFLFFKSLLVQTNIHIAWRFSLDSVVFVELDWIMAPLCWQHWRGGAFFISWFLQIFLSHVPINFQTFQLHVCSTL